MDNHSWCRIACLHCLPLACPLFCLRCLLLTVLAGFPVRPVTWPCPARPSSLARGFDHHPARPPRAGFLSLDRMGLTVGRLAPDRQALPVVLSACPARSGRPVPVAHAVLGVGMLADGEGLPVVLALFEVPACPWLRSPSSQTAKGRTPFAWSHSLSLKRPPVHVRIKPMAHTRTG